MASVGESVAVAASVGESVVSHQRRVFIGRHHQDLRRRWQAGRDVLELWPESGSWK